MPSNREWMRAFARQAASDYEAREVLVLHGGDLPRCHELHLLQMACEKLAKAQLYSTGRPPLDIQARHGFVAKQLPAILRHQYSKLYKGDPDPGLTALLREISREIDLLHPQVDGGGVRPENCEYPWTDGKAEVVAPVDWTFSKLDLRQSRNGRLFLKLVSHALDQASRA